MAGRLDDLERQLEAAAARVVLVGAAQRAVRAQGVRSLANLWGNRLTWRVNDFFPILDATWEARLRVQVVGGTLAGSSELVQLMTPPHELVVTTSMPPLDEQDRRQVTSAATTVRQAQQPGRPRR